MSGLEHFSELRHTYWNTSPSYGTHIGTLLRVTAHILEHFSELRHTYWFITYEWIGTLLRVTAHILEHFSELRHTYWLEHFSELRHTYWNTSPSYGTHSGSFSCLHNRNYGHFRQNLYLSGA
ncbi:hypothetical protein DPMN_131036 [Dreissena polymorpha]|uniref:Uncharacterized protein n=1 Tax=Dreissena polymorpha TaxID=45954 RepID=A0A9D4H7S8_DREPO|nr:hypothetical protein DPMN_131036 [Dreissena polymorpha]